MGMFTLKENKQKTSGRRIRKKKETNKKQIDGSAFSARNFNS